MAKAPANASWAPIQPTLAEAHALRSLQAGTADAEAQRRALRWIVERAAGTYEPSYRVESDRDTCHAEGRRHVGLSIVKWLNMPADLLAQTLGTKNG